LDEGLGAVAIWCRRAEAVQCSAATAMSRYGSPAWGSSGGDSVTSSFLLPSSVFLSLGGGGEAGNPWVARV